MIDFLKDYLKALLLFVVVGGAFLAFLIIATLYPLPALIVGFLIVLAAGVAVFRAFDREVR